MIKPILPKSVDGFGVIDNRNFSCNSTISHILYRFSIYKQHVSYLVLVLELVLYVIKRLSCYYLIIYDKIAILYNTRGYPCMLQTPTPSRPAATFTTPCMESIQHLPAAENVRRKSAFLKVYGHLVRER